MDLYPLIAFPMTLVLIGLFIFLNRRHDQEYDAIWGGRVPKWLHKKKQREFNKKIKKYEKWIRTAYNHDDLNKAIKNYENFINGKVFVVGKGKNALIRAFPDLDELELADLELAELEIEELKKGSELL